MRVPSFLTKQTAAVDARAICAVVDQHGGAVIYDHDRPAYYLFCGRVVHGDLGHPGGRRVARIHAERDRAQAVDCRRLFL